MDLPDDVIPEDVIHEVERQVGKWGTANSGNTDDRWLEIALDEWNDLRWACRTRQEVPGHTMAKERAQLIAVLIRWHADAAASEKTRRGG